MTPQELIEVYSKTNQINLINNVIKEKKCFYLSLKGVHGSLLSIINSSFNSCSAKFNLVILPNEIEAQNYLNDILTFNAEEDIFLFPSSYKSASLKDSIDMGKAIMRTEVLKLLTETNEEYRLNKIAITYPDAINELVASSSILENKALSINLNDEIDLQELIDQLFDLGFERTDFVYEPGTYAIRGGIVDIFSFSNQNPFRLELTGNSINSLRTFNPNNQISLKELENIYIINDLSSQLSNNERTSIYNLLPKESIIWIKDATTLSIQQQNDTIIPIFNVGLPVIHIGNNIPENFPEHQEIIFSSKSQPSFNKNFQLLNTHLKENLSNNIINLISSDNPKQIDRLNSIFHDINFLSDNNTPLEELDSTRNLFGHFHTSFSEGFIDYGNKIACYTDHQLFNRNHKNKLKKGFNKSRAVTLKDFSNLSKGDYVVHIDHGIGQFAGLEKIDLNGKQQEAIRLVYKEGDILYVSIHSLHRISKYSGKEGFNPKLDKIGSAAWKKLKERTKKKVKDIAKDLIKLYAKRKAKKGFEFSADTYLQNELEASFIFEDTPDQLTATQATKRDMELPVPMDRLICGDVGFGKTEIAVRAAFKAVADNKQVAILVPTTILAMQHYQTFSKRLKDFPCNIDFINRFKSAKQQKESLVNLETGKTDIIIGTHRLVSKDVKFSNLGLLIIDEEQKFGVSTKEKLKSFRVNVDSLTLTATPIPRTLQFSLMGARDLSIINTPPPNRYPIKTQLLPFNHNTIAEAINTETNRGGQVFFVHNRVQNIEEIANLIKKICPKVKVATGHGQMEGSQLEKVMINFIEGNFDVLVATTIIESGLDIPNANTIIINNAHHYGLSDLHQMRGRVGRSNEVAFCFLLTPPLSTVTPEARRRLNAIEEFSELGSGFNIAMRDLDIRGAGNLLGAEQSGFINELGFETYHKVLEEAVQELKESEFKGLFDESEDKLNTAKFAKDCQIETDMEILIPDSYVNLISERLALYKELNNVKNLNELEQYKTMLIDRFGPMPKQANSLLESVQIKWLAATIGFKKLVLKQGKMIGYYITEKESLFFETKLFNETIAYIANNPSKCILKEENNKLSLVFDKIESIEEAKILFESIIKLSNDNTQRPTEETISY